MSPSVVIVDSHDLYRSGLCTVLEANGCKVLGTYSSLREGLENALYLKPDLVICDIDLGDSGTGIELIEQLLQHKSPSRAVILTGSSSEKDVVAALRAGADGYLMKDTPDAELAMALRAIESGKKWISSFAAETVFNFVRSGYIPPSNDSADFSARELEVLRLLAQGKDNNDIADALSISPRTVKNHIAKIIDKAGVSNRVEAAVFAVRTGIA